MESGMLDPLAHLILAHLILFLQDDVMLFMKGTPDAPRCGFSRTCVEILNGEGLSAVD
jgi:glutaredoxin-related protein